VGCSASQLEAWHCRKEKMQGGLWCKPIGTVGGKGPVHGPRRRKRCNGLMKERLEN
jgi:hypothetical protein